MSEHVAPQQWRVVPLQALAAVRYGKAKPSHGGSVPVVGSSGVYSHTLAAIVHFPTLVIGRKGSAGKVWLISEPCWPADTAFYLEWRDCSASDLRFLYYAMSARPLSGEHARTTMPSLQKHDVENFEFLLPPLAEQIAIVRALHAVQHARNTRHGELAAERERKAALMEDLFTYGLRGEPSQQIDVGAVPQSWSVRPLLQVADIVYGVQAAVAHLKDSRF